MYVSGWRWLPLTPPPHPLTTTPQYTFMVEMTTAICVRPHINRIKAYEDRDESYTHVEHDAEVRGVWVSPI